MLPRHLEIIYRDQPPPARCGPGPLPRRRGTRAAREPGRGGRASARSAWPTWRSSARTAPMAWPRFTPSCCARRRSRIWPRCFPSASTTRPTASRRGAGCCWRTRRSPARSPRPSATAGSPTSANCASSSRLADDEGFRDAFRKAKREAKAQFADWLRSTSGQTVDPGHASSIARSSAFTNTSGNC